jgi:hypothetical protein
MRTFSIFGRFLSGMVAVALLANLGCAPKKPTAAKEPEPAQPEKKPQADNKPPQADKPDGLTKVLPKPEKSAKQTLVFRWVFGKRLDPRRPGENVVIEAMIEDGVLDKNLTDEEIGLDPDLPTNYNVDRIKDVSVPGPVKPGDKITIAPDGPPKTLPPPKGFPQK